MQMDIVTVLMVVIYGVMIVKKQNMNGRNLNVHNNIDKPKQLVL